MKLHLFVALLLAPTLISAKHIDTRDLTPQLKQVQRLIGSKRNTSGLAAAQVASATIFAAGLGASISGVAYRPYYRSPYYGYRRYYNSASLIGNSLLAAGLISSAMVSAEAESINQNNATIEQKIINIIRDLVRTDEDYLKEALALNMRISNRGEQLKTRLDQDAKTQLETIYAPSNRMESNFQQELEAVPTRYNIQQYINALNALSNQLLGIEPSTKTRQEIKAEAKPLIKALTVAKKGQAKEIKVLTRKAVKDRKMFLKTLRRPINQVLIGRQKEYDAFIDESNKEIDTLFQKYYQAYYAKLM
ncbi:MAG: hypothetical protein ACRC9L_01605 [Brevinema sp.]